MLSVVLLRKCGANTPLTKAVALVRPQVNFLAISESGNILRNNFVAWSLARKVILCLATKIAHCVSASMALWEGQKGVRDCDDVLAL